MNVEIERRFFPKNDDWRKLVDSSTKIRQSYLSVDINCIVRVRVEQAVDLTLIGANAAQACLTIKGKRCGMVNTEYEYDIPPAEAISLLDICVTKPVIKIRHRIKDEKNNVMWEIDQFLDELQGLVIIEVELSSVDQQVILPEWVGQEITDDSSYSNVSLAKSLSK